MILTVESPCQKQGNKYSINRHEWRSAQLSQHYDFIESSIIIIRSWELQCFFCFSLVNFHDFSWGSQLVASFAPRFAVHICATWNLRWPASLPIAVGISQKRQHWNLPQVYNVPLRFQSFIHSDLDAYLIGSRQDGLILGELVRDGVALRNQYRLTLVLRKRLK